MKYSKIIWGLILISAGLLIILKNADILYFQWHWFFNLWPLILVFIGISKLPVNDYIKLSLSVIALFIGFLIIFSFKDVKFNKQPGSDQSDEWNEQLIHKPYNPSIKKAVLHFNSSLANVIIEKSDNYLIEFSKSGDLTNYNLAIYPINDSVSDIFIDMDYYSLDLKKKSII